MIVYFLIHEFGSDETTTGESVNIHSFYIYIHTYIHTHIYIYIYIYIYIKTHESFEINYQQQATARELWTGKLRISFSGEHFVRCPWTGDYSCYQIFSCCRCKERNKNLFVSYSSHRATVNMKQMQNPHPLFRSRNEAISHTHAHTHTCIYIYIYIYMYECAWVCNSG